MVLTGKAFESLKRLVAASSIEFTYRNKLRQGKAVDCGVGPNGPFVTLDEGGNMKRYSLNNAQNIRLVEEL